MSILVCLKHYLLLPLLCVLPQRINIHNNNHPMILHIAPIYRRIEPLSCVRVCSFNPQNSSGEHTTNAQEAKQCHDLPQVNNLIIMVLASLNASYDRVLDFRRTREPS